MSKEILKSRLAAVTAALKSVPGTGVHDIRNFIDGKISFSKGGNVKLPLHLPADKLLPDEKDLGSILRGDWKILPLLLFIDSAPEEDEAVPESNATNEFEGYELVELKLLKDFEHESSIMNNAIHYYYKKFQKEGLKAYSLRYAGSSLLTLSVRSDNTAHHVVGSKNRRPTPHELSVLKHFLEEIGASLQYDSTAEY